MFAAARGNERFFKKGNLQFIILNLLLEEPKHGYQIIKDLEAKFKGFYSASPGSVYPILQMLEDREFVSISKDGKKKVYTITDEGKQFLEENGNNDEFTKRMEQFQSMDMGKMKESRSELQELFKSFMLAGKISMQDDKKYEQFQQLIKETKEKLQQFREEK
ncbi:PadR family transcriptional regulator [Mammaliicoccus lentus]|uniref:PadR family transcriptional regulator n=2 Tax=Mammaliicoccus lentus TaxID=42858 RepID=A0AAX3WA92_MAMLE|nr:MULTISPECIES: PadR family transcriptional regulator [Mammaliicoccus]MCR1873187.1 PadR family transcriptional regulator [Mammaliicoccus lentus]MDQ7142068.1 PadR family transcriptional regulator [Mammaliicoccus lentus]MEB5685156.1 PadR family transcriptional regulator [Mammaliicoccus lentus]WGZ44687.1 PadR family transcriptional regulator [Mammaliicoccus lentus]WHI56026.1 PadR family transcriptional regulator [Mammaliicoccus lentus]